MGGGRLDRLVARVALVNESDLDHLARRRLHLSGQFLNLGPILRVGQRDEQGQQMSQRIYRDVDLAAVLPLGAVVGSPLPAFGA